MAQAKRNVVIAKPKKSELQFARTAQNLAKKGKTNKKLSTNQKARKYQ